MVQLVKPKRKKKADLSFVATCGTGLEELVAREITEQGGKKTVINPGAVSWEGNLEAGYRLCLWSRFASRVLLQIARFDAPDQDTLYRQTGKIDWDEHFRQTTTFAVFSTVTDSPITHSKFAALRVKDAIVDQFRSRTRRRPDVDTSRPGMRINLHLHGRQATLAVDLAGDSLHRRGYRLAVVEAPLKETLAAAIARLAGVTTEFAADGALLDPMCGSGTLLIEAAMLFGDVAPGLQRKTFGFMFWNRHDERLWEKLVSEALEREERGMEKPWPQIIGYDADPKAVKAARQNIIAAGLEDKIQIGQLQLADLKRPAAKGILLINPPYGERMSEREEIKYLYRCLGRKIGQELYGWRVGFFSSNPDLAGSLNMDWTDTFRLFNGPIKCRLQCGIATQISAPARSLPDIPELQTINPDDNFAGRLALNCTSLFPWARRKQVTCFRIYDADLPDYPITVDLYEDMVYVRESPPSSPVNREKARALFNAALQAIRTLLAIPPSRVFISRREPLKTKPGSRKGGGKEKIFEVQELNCRFLVNFTGRPGTDLPLDQRNIRLMIGGLAPGKTFLNLFGGTGTATAHALVNNAIATTTVDAAGPALQRARANFALNGYGGPQHTVVQADCLKWLVENRARYSLILVNPPASSTDGHRKTSFNVRHDHEKLLRLAMHRLAREGLLIFATDSPQFTLADPLSREFDIREISALAVPEDFKQSKSTLRCWELRHGKEITHLES